MNTSKKDQTPVEDEIPFVVLETELMHNPDLRFGTTDMATFLDATGSRAKPQIIENNVAERREAAPTLREFVDYQPTDAFCKQGTKNVGHTNAEYAIGKNGLVI